MKFLKITMACAVALAFAAGPLTVLGAEETKTCCELKANTTGGTDCAHKCCIEAHNAGKSCEKCNPKKQDEKYLKKDSGTNAPAKK